MWVGLIDSFEYKGTPVGFIACQESGSSSVALPGAWLPGDLALVMAEVATSSAPGIPAGWTGWQRPVPGTSISWGYRILQVTDTTTGTWTGAQRVCVAIYRNARWTSWNVQASTPATTPPMDQGTTVVLQMWKAGGDMGGSSVAGYTARGAGMTSIAGHIEFYVGDCFSPQTAQTPSPAPNWYVAWAISPPADAGRPISGTWDSEDADYWYSTFLALGGLSLTVNYNCTAEVLIVAGGGGGGGGKQGGGGGGGGVRYLTNYTLTSGTMSGSVGDGGAGAVSSTFSLPGTDGSNTTFDGNTATGGGGGAAALRRPLAGTVAPVAAAELQPVWAERARRATTVARARRTTVAAAEAARPTARMAMSRTVRVATALTTMASRRGCSRRASSPAVAAAALRARATTLA